MSDFQTVAYSDELLPEVLELTRATLGAGGAVAKTEDYWRWKHHSNPFGPSYGLCALDSQSGQLAALRILLRWSFRAADGVELKAVRAVDTATHPNYQRQGLFSSLTQAAIEELRSDGVRLIFNTPNEKSLPGYLKMGWKLVDRLPMYMRPLRPMRMLGRQVGFTTKTKSDARIVQDDYFDPAAIMSWREFVEIHGDCVWQLAAQWETVRRQVGWRTQRSAEYLHWRFGENPNVDYYVFSLPSPKSNGGALQALAILRPNVRNGWQEVVLSDMLLVEPDVRLGSWLLSTLARQVRSDYLIAHFAAGTVEHECVRKSGFRRIPRQGMQFTVRSLDDDVPSMTQRDDWDLCLGDLELF